MRVLVMTAVVEEAETVLAALGRRPGQPAAAPVTVGPYRSAWRVPLASGEALVVVGGVGPAAAAAATATVLATESVDLVLDAGVAGGFAPRAVPDSVVLADRVVAADLGAETGSGFLPLEEMDFGPSVHVVDAGLVARAEGVLATGSGAVVVGTVLTVSTVTGSAATRDRLIAQNPGAVAEAMEGFGVLTAAAAHGVPALELRTVSNPVGVSDRAQWDLPGAFARLGAAAAALVVESAALVGDAPADGDAALAEAAGVLDATTEVRG